MNGAIVRLCTLAFGGRITIDILEEEIKRLKSLWEIGKIESEERLLDSYEHIIDTSKIDLFEQIQIDGVLKVCITSKSLSDAGRKLFAISRLSKSSSNDSDRLKKFLGKYGLTWEMTQTKYI